MMKKWLGWIRSTWGHLAQLACWIGAAIGTFLQQPPARSLTAAPDKSLRYFAQFIGAVFLGIIYILCLRWQRKKDVGRWVAITILGAAVTVGAFFADREFRSRSDWTCQYAGQTLTIGGPLTPDAATYSKQLGGEPACYDLLAFYGGDPYLIWQKVSIESHYQVLSWLMIAVWLGAATSIMSVTQAIRCATA
jgi:hypothetical protein